MKIKKKRRTKQSKHKRRVVPLAVPIFLIIIILILSFYILSQSILLPSVLIVPELSTKGYVEVAMGINITEDRGIVTFVDECYELSMIVDRMQAISIENGINGIIGFRPNTHDLIKDMLKSLDAKILMIKVVELKNNTYFARLIVRKDNLILSLDSRPSDAIAIAARTDYIVPIYVNESLLKNYGRKVC